MSSRASVTAPRCTRSTRGGRPPAQWADAWLGIDVGSDISLANAIAHEIIAGRPGQRGRSSGAPPPSFDAVRGSSVAATTRWSGPSATPACPAELIRQLAHDYARADRAQICWTLGITEHHNAADNVFALINLSLLTGHVAVRFRAGPAARPEQRAGRRRHGRHPQQADRVPGHRDSTTTRGAGSASSYGVTIAAEEGLAPVADVRRHGAAASSPACYIVGENPLSSEADTGRTRKLLDGPRLPGRPGHRPHRAPPMVSRRRAARHRLLVRGRGHGHQQRAPGAAGPQGARAAGRRPRRHLDHLPSSPGASARDWGNPTAEDLWNELRTLSPMHRGMSYQRLEQLGGIQWPCPDEQSAGTLFLHARLVGGRPGQARRPRPVPPDRAGRPARQAHGRVPDPAHHRPPPRLLQHRRRQQRVLHPAPAQGGAATSRPRTPPDWAWPTTTSPGSPRGAARSIVPVRADETLRAGLAFMTLHFPDQVETNILTLDTWDPKSGTAEFKATAIRVEKASPEETAAALERLQRRGGGCTSGPAADGERSPATEEERAADRLGPRPARVGLGRAAPGAARTPTPPSAATPPARASHLLMTVLHAVQERVGWISPGALDHICERLDIAPGRRVRRRLVLRAVPDRAVARARWCTSATTWPARSTGPSGSARQMEPPLRRPRGPRPPSTAPGSPGSGPRAWASATAARPR